MGLLFRGTDPSSDDHVDNRGSLKRFLGWVAEIDYAAAFNALLTTPPRASGATEAQTGVTQFATAAEVATAASTTKAVSPARLRGDAAWIPLPFEAGWSQFGSGFAAGAYRKDGAGFVHIKGVVAYTSGAAITIATLPVGYRPNSTELFPTTSGGIFGTATVNAAGALQSGTRNAATGNLWMSLSGITYLAEG